MHCMGKVSIVINMKRRRSRGESGVLKERKLRRGTIWAAYCCSNKANGRRIIHVRVAFTFILSFDQVVGCGFLLNITHAQLLLLQ